MILYAIFALINGIAAFFFGLFGFLRNTRSALYQTFGALNFVAALWSFSYFVWQLSQISNNESGSLFWARVLAVFATLIPVLYVHWIISVLNKNKEKKRFIIFSYVITGIFLILSFTPFYVISVKPIAGFPYWPQGGLLYALYVGFLYLGLSGFGFFQLVKNYNKVTGYKREQIKYLIVGATFAFGGGVFNFPQWFGVSVKPYGNALVFLYVVIFGYAMLKHRLMDIRIAVVRSMSYLLLISVLAGIYAGSILAIERLLFPETSGLNLTQGAIRTALAVIMAFSFQPLRRWITKATDKVFFKNQYNSDEFLDTLSHTIGGTIVLVEMIYKTLGLIREQIKVTRGMMVIIGENGGIYNSQSFGYKEVHKLESEDMQKLGKDGVLVYDELEETSHYKRLLRKPRHYHKA